MLNPTNKVEEEAKVAPEKPIEQVIPVAPPMAPIMPTQPVEQAIRIFDYPDKSIHVTLTSNKMFSFYDINNHLIGSFNILNIIKYISTFIDSKNIFLPDQDITENKSIIESFICIILPQNKYGLLTIKMHTPNKSPFMGDINTIIPLYKLYRNYCNSELNIHLGVIDDKNLVEVLHRNIKLFGFTLVEHVLQILSNISLTLKDDKTNIQLKEKITRYSIGLVYESTKYVNSELTDLRMKYTLLNNGIEEIKNISALLQQKIDKII